ncbi:MAG TPA: TIGR03862 family flavoprotein [Flavobacteriales bacterium]
MERPHVAIIGAGPAGLMAAWELAPQAEVEVHEHGKAIARKFLVAGQGGFNLTNSVDGAPLKAHYAPTGFLDAAIEAFGSQALRDRLADVGIPTHVGSSGRVFPDKGIKPITVLNALQERLLALGVRFRTGSAFVGFDEQARPLMEEEGVRRTIEADAVFFALGGASWPVTGSTGNWLRHFEAIGVRTRPWQPSNCGVEIPWPVPFAQAHAGKPLKNIRITVGDRSVRGEASITVHGLEGNGIYPVVPALREALAASGSAQLTIDLKPDLTAQQLLGKLVHVDRKDFASALHLDRPSTALLKAFTTKEEFFDPQLLAGAVKALRLPVTGLRPLEEAISSVGGIPVEALSPDFSLKSHPRLFTLGEMVDWDAPTGGFLLQGCFAMGHHAARAFLARR